MVSAVVTCDVWVSLVLQLSILPLRVISLDSVSRSPLYSIYGETISGVPILRAFGASSKFMRDMIRCVDTVSFSCFIVASFADRLMKNTNPYYWLWGGMCRSATDVSASHTHDGTFLLVNRWISARFNVLSSLIIGMTGVVVLVSPGVSAALAGFALAFSNTVSMEVRSQSFFRNI